MARLLSNLVNNLAEGVHKIKCKYGHDNKKCETRGVNTNIVNAALNSRKCMSVIFQKKDKKGQKNVKQRHKKQNI